MNNEEQKRIFGRKDNCFLPIFAMIKFVLIQIVVTIGFTIKIYIEKAHESSIFHEIGDAEILIGNLWVGTSPIARFGAHHRHRRRILHRHGTPQYFRSVPVACGDFARFGPTHSSLLNKRRYISHKYTLHIQKPMFECSKPEPPF